MSNFTHQQVAKVSEFLQNHMRTNGIHELTADECASILADNKILSNESGPKPGFTFRQMLRDGRDKQIPMVAGASQEKVHARWKIILVKG
ncbi:MAG: hypothetical protein CVU44_12990 [Chloroflexi bacterium HGW-Chloroflexi-6]|nr:MAG: hypothetical protein CVU44_12990 [Chloroflexi bacterium HGW-Chloroflexi-6]